MVKVALAQVNPTVGDLPGNARLLAQAARAAHAAGARVVLAPELALTGYPPEDLLLRPAFLQACEAALGTISYCVVCKQNCLHLCTKDDWL